MRITFILEDQTGQQKQFEFDTPFVVKRALFSEILSDLDRNQNQITFKISSDSPNKAIEDKYHEERKREMQYYEALRDVSQKTTQSFVQKTQLEKNNFCLVILQSDFFHRELIPKYGTQRTTLQY